MCIYINTEYWPEYYFNLLLLRHTTADVRKVELFCLYVCHQLCILQIIPVGYVPMSHKAQNWHALSHKQYFSTYCFVDKCP